MVVMLVMLVWWDLWLALLVDCMSNMVAFLASSDKTFGCILVELIHCFEMFIVQVQQTASGPRSNDILHKETCTFCVIEMIDMLKGCHSLVLIMNRISKV